MLKVQLLKDGFPVYFVFLLMLDLLFGYDFIYVFNFEPVLS